MASSSGSLIPPYNHKVFLSFKGKDTRAGFAYNLYQALERENIKTFFDDFNLRRGANISSGLFEAIKVSSISVVICSENYASSRWCLDELVKILECKNSNRQTVIPVFYKVNPTDVKHQTGRFGQVSDDLTSKSSKYNQDKIPEWKAALTQVGNLAGLTYVDGYESDFIVKIVKEIKEAQNRLNGAEVNVLQYSPEFEGNQIGMELYNRTLHDVQSKVNGADLINQAYSDVLNKLRY